MASRRQCRTQWHAIRPQIESAGRIGWRRDSTSAPADARHADSAQAFDTALRRLPPKARKVYILHDVEGHSQDECALLLGIATGTVRAQLHRARRLMREVLER